MSCKSIVIDGVEFVPKANGELDGDVVLVRTYSAGVHFGSLHSRNGKEVELHNARRIWSWVGANTLSEIANNGCGKGSKVSEPVASITLTEAIEIIPMTKAAVKAMAGLGWTK